MCWVLHKSESKAVNRAVFRGGFVGIDTGFQGCWDFMTGASGDW